MSQNFVVEADYNNYAGEAEKPQLDEFAYYDYNSPVDIDTNEIAINNSIRNILLTRIGSVPGKPEFGSNIMNIVFDLMDGNSTSDLLKNSIIGALLKWEPRISINNIVIKEIPEYNRLIADINYTYNILGGNIDASTTILLQD